MSYSDYLNDRGSDVYYSKEFRKVIEDHLTYLKQHKSTEIIMPDIRDIGRYTGNLNGYLVELKKPVFLHWIIMRCSGYKSYLDFNINTDVTIRTPHISVIDKLRQKSLMISS